METYTNDELLEVLPSSVKDSKDLTTKQKILLGQLIIYNGLDKTKADGYFYRSNKDLCKDCDIHENTLITAVIKLESLGLIKRKRGNRKDGASEYRLNMEAINNYCKTEIEDNSNNQDYSNDYSNKYYEMLGYIKELEITVKKLEDRITVIEGKNCSTDTESDIDKEKDKVIYNNINNNIINKENFEKIENKEKTEEVKVKEDEIKEEVEIKEKSNKEVKQSQLVKEDSEKEKLNESQLPFEVLVSTDELDNINEHNTNDEESYVPTEEEKQILKDGIKIVNHYLTKMQTVTSEMIIYSLRDDMMKCVKKYIASTDGVTDWVIEHIEDRMETYFNIRRKELEEQHREEIKRQLQLNSLYASFY